jgi:hypothetical protein
MINFTTFFTRIGSLGGLINSINAYQKTTLPTDVAFISSEYTSQLNWIDGLQGQLAAAQQTALGITGFVQTIANTSLNQTVYLDNPQLQNTNIAVSMAELIRQMVNDSQTVQASTIGQTITANSSNVGNGVLLCSTQDSNGTILENIIPETVKIACVQDSAANPSIAGSEVFQVTGTVPDNNPFDYAWPQGSGASTSLSAINGSLSNSGGNLLRNGDFEIFTVNNVPDGWVIAVGTAGVTVWQEFIPYTGASAVMFHGNGSELTSITQQFGISTGTLGTPIYQTAYGINAWVKCDVPSGNSGVLQIDIIDSNGNVVLNNDGSSLRLIKNCSAMSSGYAPISAVFQTPYGLPSSMRIRIHLTTALTSGTNLYVDRIAMGPMTQLYKSGPSFAVFSGSVNFFVPDFFTAALTNSYGGGSVGTNFQTLFDRLYGMKNLGLQLPSQLSSPSISNSLITT